MPAVPRSIRSLAVASSNLVPLAGVVLLGWSPAIVLGVYVLEVVAITGWTLLAVPFAEKRPNNAFRRRSGLLASLQEKRGGVRLHGRLPPVYPRNVPTMLAVAFAGGLATVCAFGVFALTDPELRPAAAGSILLGGFAVVCARGLAFWVDYLRGAGYRDHSPRSLALTVLRHVFGVGSLFAVVLVLGVSTAGEPTLEGRAVVAALVCGKLLYDLRSAQVSGTEGKRGWFARLYGSAQTEIEPVPVETPEGSPLLRVTPTGRAAAVGSLARGIRFALTRGGIVVYPVAILAAFSDPAVGLLVGALVALPFVAFGATVHYVRYGTQEFLVYDDVIVAHDRWLDEPQRRLRTAAITDVSVSPGLAGRLFDAATIELDANVDEPDVRLFAPSEAPEDPANEDRPITMVGIAEAERVREAIEGAPNFE